MYNSFKCSMYITSLAYKFLFHTITSHLHTISVYYIHQIIN